MRYLGCCDVLYIFLSTPITRRTGSCTSCKKRERSLQNVSEDYRQQQQNKQHVVKVYIIHDALTVVPRRRPRLRHPRPHRHRRQRRLLPPHRPNVANTSDRAPPRAPRHVPQPLPGSAGRARHAQAPICRGSAQLAKKKKSWRERKCPWGYVPVTTHLGPLFLEQHLALDKFVVCSRTPGFARGEGAG